MATTPADFVWTAEELAYDRAQAELHRLQASGQLPKPDPTFDVNGVRAWRMEDLRYRPKPVWFVEQMVEEKGLTVFFGPDKAGKTAVISSMLWAWVAGQRKHYLSPTFRFHSPPQRETDVTGDEERKVLYLLLEGQASYWDRYEAWKYGNGLTEDVPGFLVVDTSVSLFTPGFQAKARDSWGIDLRAVTQIIEEFRPHILVVDTFSRATAGIDENSSQVAQVVAWFDLIRDTVGCATVVVHHTSLDKQASSRPRGHSSLKGAASSYVRIEQNEESGPRRLVVGPHRNAEAKNPPVGKTYGYYFTMREFRNAFVVEPTEDSPVERPKSVPLLGRLVVDVAKELKVSKRTVYRLVSDDPELLVEDGMILRNTERADDVGTNDAT